MMSSTLALRFTAPGVDKTTAEMAKLALVVAQLQSAAATGIKIPVSGGGGGGGRGGGGGGGGEVGGGKGRAPRDPAAAAEAAAAKQAEAAAKVAAREEAASAKAQRAAQKYIETARLSNKMSALRQADLQSESKAASAAAMSTHLLAKDMQAAGISTGSFSGAVGSAVSGLGAAAGAAATVATAITAVATAAVAGAASLASMAAEGEKLKVVAAAYEKLGGSAKELQGLREMTGGVVGDTDLQKAMNLAKLFKLPAEEVPKLVKLAQGAGAALGETTAKMLGDTFTAASRGSKMIADNMGIVMGDLGKVYDDYAKKVGKTSGDQLTDQQRTAAFVSKMVAEGGRQMELATIAQGDAAAKSAANWDNLSGNMMIAVADMFSSMGVWDALSGAMGGLESLFMNNKDAIADALAPAFQGLADLMPPVIKAVATLLPILAPLGQLFSVVGAAINIMLPWWGFLTKVISETATFVIDLVSQGLEPLMRAAAKVAGILSDDMASAFRDAADSMANARQYINPVTKDIQEQGEAAKTTAEELRKLAALEAMKGTGTEKTAGDFAIGMKGLAGAGADVAAFRRDFEAMTKANMKGSAVMFADFKNGAQGMITGAQRAGMSLEAAQEAAMKEMLVRYGVSYGNYDKAIELMKQEAAVMATMKADEARMNEEGLRRAHDAAVRQVQDLQDLVTGSEQAGQDLLAQQMMLGAESQDEAFKRLKEYEAKYLAVIGQMKQGAAKQAAEETLDAVVSGASGAIALGYGTVPPEKPPGGSRNKRDDLTPLLDRAARVGMNARQLALADADKQFAADLKAAGKSAEGIAAAQGLYLQARTDAWLAAGKEQLGSMGAQGAALMAMGRQWLDDAAAVVEMTKAAEATMKMHRLATEEVGVGDSAEGITRRRTEREVAVVMEVEALKAEWEAKASALQVGSAAYETVLAEHQRKVADLTKEGINEKAAADATAMMDARFAMFAGYGEIFGQVSGQIQQMVESGDEGQQAVAYTLGGFLSMASEMEGVKGKFTELQTAVNKGQISETQAGVAGAGHMAAAVGRSAASIIKSKQGIAIAEALVQVGLAAASFASYDYAGGIGHTIAAGLLFTAGGKGGGGGAAARTLTPRRSAAGSDRASGAADKRQARQEINIIISPITGQAIINESNKEGMRRAGTQFSSRLLPDGARRPDL